MRFEIRKKLIGFDAANLYLQRVDKNSLRLILKNNGAQIGENCDLETGLVFHNCRNYANLLIGKNCHIGKNCFFDLRSTVEIKDQVVISMQCSFITHQDLGHSSLSDHYPSKCEHIKIKENVYIGAGVKVLMGVEVGENSMLAAGAVVINDIPSNVIAGGIPAKIIKPIV